MSMGWLIIDWYPTSDTNDTKHDANLTKYGASLEIMIRCMTQLWAGWQKQGTKHTDRLVIKSGQGAYKRLQLEDDNRWP